MGRVARVLSTVAGVVLILIGISMVAPPSGTADPPPAAVSFRIVDELGENQYSEQVTVLLDGKIVGNLTVNYEFPHSEIAVAVAKAGQYSYTVEATAYFYDAETGKVVPYTGIGQGMIQVDDRDSFRLAGSASGSSWVITLVEF